MKKLKLRFLKVRQILRIFFLKVRGLFKLRFRQYSKLAVSKVPTKVEIRLLTASNVILIILVLFGLIRGFFILRPKYMELVPQKGGIYREGVVGTFQNLNPLYSVSNPSDQDAVVLIYSGLLRVDKGLKTVPDLAESVTSEQDGRVFKVILRENLRWHDGAPLTADDVVFTIETIKNPDAGSPLQKVWRGVRVEKVSDRELKFNTPKIASFQTYLTQPIVPAHKLKDIPVKNLAFYDEFNLRPVGSGPFSFNNLRSLSDGQELNLTASASFYGDKSYINGVTLRSYNSDLDAVNGLEKKEVFSVAGLTGSNLGRVMRIKPLDSVPLRIAEYTAVFMNTKEPNLDNLKIRTAVSHAINRDKIISFNREERYPVYGPIPSGYLGYSAKARGPEYDPEKAKLILENAGWSLEKETATNSKGEELIFKLVAPEGESFDDVVNRTVEDLKAVHIKVNVERPAIVDYQASYLIPRNYGLIIASENAGYDPDPYLYWHSTQSKDPGLNLSQLSSSKVDSTLEAARRASDAKTREARYREFQQLIAADVPAVFLYGRYYYYTVSDEVNGIARTDYARIVEPKDRLANISEWYMNTKWVWKSKDKK